MEKWFRKYRPGIMEQYGGGYIDKAVMPSLKRNLAEVPDMANKMAAKAT
jgi:hypothetical protein